MKPELDLFQKQRFYAQYYGTKTFYSAKHNLIGAKLSLTYPELAVFEGGYLLLRPLSSITDDEAIEVAKAGMSLEWMSPFKQYFRVEKDKDSVTVRARYSIRYFVINTLDGDCLCYGEDDLTGNGTLIHCYQLMLSMGFAIPFMGHSVEELVGAGWVRLVEPETP